MEDIISAGVGSTQISVVGKWGLDVEGRGVCEGFGFVGGEGDFGGEFALPYSLQEERWQVFFFVVVGREVGFRGGEVLS